MDKPTFTFGSLFSGIGGLDLGLEKAGMQCAWQVENNDFCTKVLAKHWPDVARYGDVRHVGKHNLTRCDLIAGGFPCQPHSQAGERKASKDERDLWPEFYRLICELEPRWVVAENVLGLLSSEDGIFFGGVLRDLAKAGYDARWRVLSAAQFGAPHLRERVIIVAHAGSHEWWQSAEGWRHVLDRADAGWQKAPGGFEFCGEELANASEPGLSIRGCAGYTTNGTQDGTGLEPQSERHGELAHADFQSLEVGQCLGGNAFTQCTPTERDSNCTNGSRAVESCLGRATSRFPSWLDRYHWPAGPGQQQYEWEAPRVTTEKVANRTARLKGLGNAVVPALAEYIGRQIMAAEAERLVVA